MIESPYPELSMKLYGVFKEFIHERNVNHCDLYNTLIMFVGAVVKITYNKDVPDFTDEHLNKLASGLKEYFGDCIDLAVYKDGIH